MVNFEENTLEEKWELKRISEFFYLLVDASDPSGKDILQKRFKKEPNAQDQLYLLIERIGKLGYMNGVDYAFRTSLFDTIKGPIKSLIEIRKFSDSWRVLTYNDSKRKKLVMLDAFQAHKHVSTLKAAQRVESKMETAKKLLERDE